MFKRRLIVTSSFILVLIIASIVDRYTGFKIGYFAISTAAALAAYWIVEFLIDLIYYSYDVNNEFQLYIAEKVNKTMLNYDDIKAKEKFYYKEFKRSRRKGKWPRFLKLIFAMGIFIFLICCMI